MRQKLFTGKPKYDESWLVVGRTNLVDDVYWVVCMQDKKAKWRNIKISAQGAVPFKANYWTAWDGERMSDSRDWQIMDEKRPELKQAVIDVIDRAVEIGRI